MKKGFTLNHKLICFIRFVSGALRSIRLDISLATWVNTSNSWKPQLSQPINKDISKRLLSALVLGLKWAENKTKVWFKRKKNKSIRYSSFWMLMQIYTFSSLRRLSCSCRRCTSASSLFRSSRKALCCAFRHASSSSSITSSRDCSRVFPTRTSNIGWTSTSKSNSCRESW